eukprot:CAMPEP_0167744440 /NCGR_PEP_ID=MMETSP0110_2-20121227/2594_1 /TAXON_ID=629695 /ORGANISM="Gymnochlora sp., Strain CCMP2014" /LENGTH=504 /DNA_ID=CAMNT_0007628965 /DNA_START=197 /DNA_END=1711 /DNA_ORIENTATION=-
MKFPPEEIELKFSKLARPLTKESVRKFVEENFLEPGSDVISHIPEDWNPTPNILSKIETKSGKAWAKDLVEKWKSLGRRTAPSVKKHPAQTSTLWREKPFIVPGGRFRESYYWDSYWIIEGLLTCDMKQTAKNIVENLLDDIDVFGCVPNGGRIYYTTRSQPPLLAAMVDLVYESTKDVALLKRAVKSLNLEYTFWNDPKNKRIVSISVNSNESVVLNRYNSIDDTPRPESYREDIETRALGGSMSQIRAAAESGWDFSSRWMPTEDAKSDLPLALTATSSVAPIDLNAFIYDMERRLEKFHRILNRPTKAKIYTKASEKRKAAILKIAMQEGTPSLFNDVLISTGKPSSRTSAASFAVMWCGLLDSWDEKNKDKFVEKYVEKNPLLMQAGISTTTTQSKQQWDFPNAWPPLQAIAIDGLRRINTEKSLKLAENLASLWLRSCYRAWEPKGHMYEKYNAEKCGQGGGGGEYNVQLGFGWSNGVVLRLLDLYPRLNVTKDCKSNY